MDEFIPSGEASLQKVGAEHFHCLSEIWLAKIKNRYKGEIARGENVTLA